MPFGKSQTAFPHSMEWSYFAWQDLQTDYEQFDWRPLDSFLNDAAARGHQAAFRIYADYPDTPYGVPVFLMHVPKHLYSAFGNGAHATSYSPDYDNQDLKQAMLNIIRALGDRYNGDPRLGFVEVGFLGFWGEWHTYRSQCECDTWMPSRQTQRAVLDAFERSFTRTRVLVRQPGIAWKGQAIGFHDDSFGFQTLGSPDWMFVGRLKAAGATRQWRTQPIGGELFPDHQSCAFSVPSCSPPGQDFDMCVDATHASWLMNHFAFSTGYAGGDYERAMRGAQRLGYDLFVSAVRVTSRKAGQELAVDVKIQNRGTAPFYYDWNVQLGVANTANELIAIYDTDWKLTQVIERNEDVAFSSVEKKLGLVAGEYQLLIRAVNPLKNGHALVFANAGWSQTVPDWLVLAHFRQEAASLIAPSKIS